MDALYSHFEELRRWNQKLSLIGPGTFGEVVERHYGEALAALPLLGESARRLVDVGSGGGFPGFVLAAARPGTATTLIEPRQRKWAFLRSAARRAALPCQCLGARVDIPLPAELPTEIDVITLRALRLPTVAMAALRERLSENGRFLLWLGDEAPELPVGLVAHRERSLPGSERRRILELRPSG